MKRITDFKWDVDKERIFKILDCGRESPVFGQVDILYNKNIDALNDFLQPIGVYNYVDVPKTIRLSEIQECQKIVYFLLTLGSEIDKKIDSKFAQGKYLEALLLDTGCSLYMYPRVV